MAAVDEGRADLSAGAAAAVGRSEPTLGEIADKAAGRMTTAAVLASAIIALAIYSRPAPPRFDAVVGDGKIVRIDRRSGTIISCDAQGCASVLRKGQLLIRRPGLTPALKPADAPAAPPPALPRPSR